MVGQSVAGIGGGRHAGEVRNLLVGLVTVLVLASVAVFFPSTVPPEVRSLLGVGPSRLAAPAPVGTEGSYSFLQHQPGDPETPVTYNPCEVIRVQINPDGVADPGLARQVVRSAMERVSEATGLRLEYDGSSDRRPRWRTPTQPILGDADPALVSFATSDEVSALEGRVAGIGGSTSVRRGGFAEYVSGQVTLDIDTFDDLLADERTEVARAIAMHELGHLVGLGHVDDERELMNARNQGQLDFGPGDLRGLALLGRGRCA